MSWDTVPGRNGEGYPDPTASTALARVQHSQKGLQSKRAGEHFENMITASLNWYCDKGVAFAEKTPEPMKPLRKPDRQGRFLACYTKAGQPDFKGTLTGGRAVVFEAKHTDSDKIDQNRLTPEQVESLTLHHKLGAAAFIMVSVGLENAGRYLPDVPERIVAVGVTARLDTCLDLGHVIPFRPRLGREQP